MKYILLSFLIPVNLFFTVNIFSQPKVSFTFDDPNTETTQLLTWQVRNELILRALEMNNLKSTLFVCGKRVSDDKGKQLISGWDIENHQIANHSFEHKYYHSPNFSFEDFKADFYRNDSLISVYSNYTRLFRFPYLKEGDTFGKRDSARALFNQSNYKEGYVSIDASDWYVNRLLEDTLKKNPDADIEIYRKLYIKHILERAEFYDSLATILTGRKIKHVLLLHHNLVSALFLNDLIIEIKNNGWQIISSAEAWDDPIYSELPEIIPAGESIVWALAKESGKFDSILRYPGEDSEYEEVKFKEFIDSGR